MRDFTFYKPRNIFLQRLHPTTKITISVVLMFLVILVGNDVFFSAGMLGFAIVLLLAARTEWRITKPFFQVALAFSFLITISWSFFHREGHPIVLVGPFILTDQGAMIIITVLVRILTLMLLSVFILVSNSESDIIQGLRAARVPYLITFIMMLVLKFFPTLIMDHATIRDAQMARGAEFEKGSLIERATKNVAILAPLIVVSFSRALTMSVAVESRGFSPTGHGIQRTNYREKHLASKDYIVLLAILLFFSFIVFAKYFLGWFTGISTTLG